MRTSFAALAALLAAAGAAHAQQYVLVLDSSADRVMQFNAADGSIVNLDFIVDANDPGTYDFSTPKDVIQVGQEIWVSDQLEDSVFRFDQQGQFLGAIGPTGFDNLRGMEVVDGVVYVTSDGTNNGAPGNSVVTVDAATATITGSFLAQGTSPFDVLAFNGELLVSDSGTDEIYRHALDGTFLGEFHNSDGVSGIDFVQQLNLGPANTVLAAGFTDPDGVYQYDATGAQLNYWAIGSGNRGVVLLGNGNIMYTDGSGVYIFDTGDQASTLVADAGGQYANLVTFGDEPDCPADFDNSGDLTLADFVAFRNAYVAGDLAADFDNSGTLTLADFVAFRNAYVAGCP